MEQTRYLDGIRNSSGASDWADADLDSLLVRPIRPKEEAEWERLMATYHYLGYQRLNGLPLQAGLHAEVAPVAQQWACLVSLFLRLGKSLCSW